MLTKSNEKLKFKRIGVEGGNYYGVKKVKGNMAKVPLDTNYIKNVKLKDKTLSTILSIGIPLTILIIRNLVIGKTSYGLGTITLY